MSEPSRRDAGRGVGNLTGGGPSIVGTSGAMRARDVSRIRPEHLAAAERSVVVRRRPFDPDNPPEPRHKRRDNPETAGEPAGLPES